jgi:ABC-type Fe3+ transport system substrate-binding protein
MKKMLKISIIGILALVLVIPTSSVLASPKQADTLVILHPHSADFAGYVISGFKSWYADEFATNIIVDTIEKSSYSCYLDVAAWGGSNPLADIWWGGGEGLFEDAREDGNLVRYKVAEDANITSHLADWHLKDDSTPGMDPFWYGAAISGFGIMYNAEYLGELGIDSPQTWDDLIKEDYYGHIVMANPAASGSTTAAVEMVLADKSDQKDDVNLTAAADITDGWAYWAKVAGNVGEYTTSSSLVPALVYEGTYGVAITIDYYAWAKIAISVPGTVGFNYGGSSTFSPDPAAILLGASQLTQAQRFMDYLMSTEGQSRVGKYRIPVNYQAVPDSLAIPQAWVGGVVNPEFPLIDPFNVTLDGQMKTPTRNLFDKWFVANAEAASDAYEAILDATDATAKSNALALYTTLPSSFDGTIASLVDQDTTNATLTTSWTTEGAANFAAAEDEADEIYDTGTTTPTGTETSTEPTDTTTTETQVPGLEALIFLATIGTLVISRRKKR